MMGYDVVEARIQLLLQGLTSIFAEPSQVTRGDFSVLDAGYDQCAVLRPGAFEDTGTQMGPGSHVFRFVTHINFYKRYFDNATIVSFERQRDAIIEHILKYPSLNGLADTVLLNVIRGDEPGELYDRGGNGPFFITQTIDVSVSHVVTVTLAE